MSQRQIVTALDRQRVINPKTRKPWSLGTVNADVKALEAEWEEAALQDTFRRKSKVNAELQELKRAAWADRDHRLVGEVLKQERQLFNLDEPVDPLLVQVMLGNQPQQQLGDREKALLAMNEDELDGFITNMLIATDMDDVFIEGVYEEVEDE